MAEALANQSKDITIVGGGLVGLTLALILDEVSDGSYSISIIEKNSAAVSARKSERTVALSYGTQAIFTACGFWSALEPLTTPIKTIHVSDKGHMGRAFIEASKLDWPALGYVAYNDDLTGALIKEISNRQTITLEDNASISDIKFHQGSVSYTLAEKNDSVSTELLIVADGAQSAIAKQLGVSFDTHHYAQRAIVATVTTSELHNHCAFERFTDEGPIALLPITNTASSLVWTMPEELFDQRMQLSDQDFMKELRQRFGSRLGRMISVTPRAGFPLVLAKASEQVRSNMVIMGNAAHNLHPVAGQSFNLAVRDAMSLAQSLKSASKSNISIGSLATLNDYFTKVTADQQTTIELSHQLVKLFSNDSLALSVLRTIGLLSLDNLDLVKTAFAKRSAGFSDGLQTGVSA